MSGIICTLCKTLGLNHDGDHIAPGPERTCFVCSAIGCPDHDLTVAQAERDAAARDRRTTVSYPAGATTAEAAYVEETRGR